MEETEGTVEIGEAMVAMVAMVAIGEAMAVMAVVTGEATNNKYESGLVNGILLPCSFSIASPLSS